ncbi:MAG: LytTR family transcriptional regulator DNA-binding domain-containing protein [Prolixibacteraceae bacterium]
MKKDNIYLITLAAITTVVIVVGIFSMNYLYKTSESRLLESQMQSRRREAREVSGLLEQQLKSGLSKETVIDNLQRSIENTDTQTEFICMYNTTGIELCHPDPKLIGQRIDENNSTVTGLDFGSPVTFQQLLGKGKVSGGIRSLQDGRSEIVYVHPVAATDWMVASHANLSAINRQLQHLYNQFLLAHLLSGILIVFFSFVAVRLINSRYEQTLESEKFQLSQDIRSLSVLNDQLKENQIRLEAQLNEKSGDETNSKSRMLTYKKDELVSINVGEIAFLFSENATTRVTTFKQEVYHTNLSLDEIMKQLNPKSFFRINRQYIVNIQAIENILRYGNSQLKLVTNPKIEEIVIISKNKVSEFKQWLDT